MLELKAGSRLTTLYGADVEVQKLIGTGGQGYVFKVLYNGEPKAMKIYKPSALRDPKAFYKNLTNNVQKGSPSPSFLWPQDVIEPAPTPQGETFGYLMDLRPQGFAELSLYLANCVHFASFKTVMDAALQIVAAFRVLHNKGYSYQDLNDGNFFIHPKTGKVLICDNDNVAPNGSYTGILGKPRYMAPEIVRNEAKPSTMTDRFSLSVILFLMLCLTHPLEGSRYLVPCLTPDVEERLYGSEPLFILDPDDRHNGPVKGIHNNLGRIWPELPSYFKEAFLREFSHEVLFDPNLRSTEADWQKRLIRLRSETLPCRCGNEVLSYVEANHVCTACRKPLPKTAMLKLSGCDYDVPVFPGNIVFRSQLGTADVEVAGDPVIAIRRHPNDPQQLALQNRSGRTLECITPSGKRKTVENGQPIPANPGIQIRTDEGSIEIQE